MFYIEQIVREQKGRLTELIRAKQEMTDQFRHQVSQLEVDASARHRIEARMNSLQQVRVLCVCVCV